MMRDQVESLHYTDLFSLQQKFHCFSTPLLNDTSLAQHTQRNQQTHSWNRKPLKYSLNTHLITPFYVGITTHQQTCVT